LLFLSASVYLFILFFSSVVFLLVPSAVSRQGVESPYVFMQDGHVNEAAAPSDLADRFDATGLSSPTIS
jgi:hypothetical protein